MPSGTLTENGSTAAFTLNGIKAISAYGDFDGGILTLEKRVNGTWYTMNRADGAAAAFSVTDDATAIVEGNHTCRLTLAGSAESTTDIDWAVE